MTPADLRAAAEAAVAAWNRKALVAWSRKHARHPVVVYRGQTVEAYRDAFVDQDGRAVVSVSGQHWKPVPLAELQLHPAARPVALLKAPDLGEVDFPPPDCARCLVGLHHDGDSFYCPHCNARWDERGQFSATPCVEDCHDDAEVVGADGQPRCRPHEAEVIADELEPTGPYTCRRCSSEVHGIRQGTEAWRARLCGGCTEAEESRAYIDALLSKDGAR